MVYQIYPRSYKDSDGDGIGDLRGITEKLDYIKALGADVIWLCPVYGSPNDDNGYDISDYYDIMTEFGTMADFDELLREVHNRDMKLIMDLVVNHTSDEHEWFVESKKSKDNPYRDYYIWRDGKNGEPPNNWVSYFSGPVWQYDEATEQYYLHLFSKKQPDLNWENEAVRKEVYKMINWWLDKGIDGFRMDTVNMYSKVPGLPSVPGKGLQFGGEYYLNGPRIHEFLKELRANTLEGRDAMLVGEAPAVDVALAEKYTDEANKELDMIFHFELMDDESYWEGRNDKWCFQNFKAVISKWQAGFTERGWNSNYLNNHDQPRSVSRYTNDGKWRRQSATMLATMNLTLKGTAYVYQGEEIGMTNVKFDKIEDYNDIFTRNGYDDMISRGVTPSAALKHYHDHSRDNARTPMQWNSAKNAGFTDGDPWLRLNPNYKEINVESQENDKDSVLSYYKKAIAFRKNTPAIVYGAYTAVCGGNERVFAYERALDCEKYLVILNFSDKETAFSDSRLNGYSGVALSNYDRTEIGGKLILSPFEALVLK
ncbi:MAG: alpha-glucosidase [Defluviitaleaceae bacterium]|nr:alpha-glucosidase [Defluviitaleaceae bacterium]